MDTRIIAAVTAAAAVMVGVGAAGPATASGDNQVVGIEQAVGDPAGGPQTSYTVSKIMPSADPVAYPVAGQLYEATVMARATGGTVVPLAGSFTALADDGATYPARAQVSSLSAAPLTDATTTGKIYFDVIGPAPTSVISVNPPAAPLLWHQPIPGESAAGGPGGGPVPCSPPARPRARRPPRRSRTACSPCSATAAPTRSRSAATPPARSS